MHRLNRQRQPENRLHYRSKYALGHAMLTELATMLPKGSQVVVLFGIAAKAAPENLVKLAAILLNMRFAAP